MCAATMRWTLRACLHNEQMEKYFDSIGVKGASPIRQFMRTAIDGRATYP